MSVTRLDIERAEAEAEITRLRAELENVNDFIPDAVHINALPKALKSYIHDLETRADPAGDIRSRVCAEEAVEAQSMLLAELRAENDKEINHVSDLHIEISGFRAENERLKAEAAEYLTGTVLANKERYLQQTLKTLEDSVAVYESLEKEFDEVMATKDAALDRLEESGAYKTCLACGGYKGKHTPDCWHQASRKAGHE